MAREWGEYTPERRGGEIRHRLTFWVEGRRYRLASIPTAGLERKSFSSEEDALGWLAQIRGEYRTRGDQMQALAPYLGRSAPENQIGTWLGRWLEMQRDRCAAGDLSPGYLRELERWVRPGSHLAYWAEWATWEPRYGDLEDWSRALAKRGLSAKTRRNVLGAFRVFLRWLSRRGDLQRLPEFPSIQVDEHAPTIISQRTQDAILEAIPWDRRGAFLALARLLLRPGEVRAMHVEDYRDGWLMVSS